MRQTSATSASVSSSIARFSSNDAARRGFQARVFTDQFAAPAVVAYLRSRGLAVSTVPMTATSKTAVFAELRARLYSSGIELYEHRDLLAELRRLRTRYTAGSAAVVNPRVGGSHGDLAQALALAVHGHRGPLPSNEPYVPDFGPSGKIMEGLSYTMKFAPRHGRPGRHRDRRTNGSSRRTSSPLGPG